MPFELRADRRQFLKKTLPSALGLGLMGSFPMLGCRARSSLTLEFLTIPDPDGWHPALRLKGDWLIFKISDGVLSGYGEASHSKQDAACRETARTLFNERINNFDLSLDRLRGLEQELAATEPDFVTATAWSGINQALYDLLAKREQVPVWKLFRNQTNLERLELYTTINRSLRARDHADYLDIVNATQEQGFQTIKCAPFEKVVSKETAVADSDEGLETLAMLRERYPDLRIRVDFHERYSPDVFLEIAPQLNALGLDWIEEPFAIGDGYHRLRERTEIRLAAGELFWGSKRFEEFANNKWVDVIMPDVKHVGGFRSLLNVIDATVDRIEVSPHNPSGPVSTAASLHAAAVRPELVRSLEYAFDKTLSRQKYGERVEGGFVYLSDKPGWGIGVEV